MTLKIHNTASGKKEAFEPLDPKRIGMYLCGPTVYDYIHIGNARPLVVFDVLYRLLRHQYGEDNVVYVRNITDVDDKINARAKERGISIQELTEETIGYFNKDLQALNCLPPTHEPQATEHIDGMIEIIKILIEKNHAYVAEGNVLFDVSSMVDYGKFANITQEELIAGARVETAPFKKNPEDFVLWKPSIEGDPSWQNPWNDGGRPGWHIECSAMSRAHLGESFDLHMGGQDLIFPHHQNEIAQSCCAFGHDSFAKYWLHNGYLLSEGEKMSKSLGNFYTVNGLMDKEKCGGDAIRLLLLQTHYRQPLNFSKKRIKEAASILGKFYRIIDSFDSQKDKAFDAKNITPFVEALNDDLNTPMALYHWYESMEAFKLSDSHENFMAICSCAELLGISCEKTDMSNLESEIDKQVAMRDEAKKKKDFATADRIRDRLKAMGVMLEDSPDGTKWKRRQ